MKHSIYIGIALFMASLLVMGGAGVTFVYCAHSGTGHMALFDDSCCNDMDDCADDCLSIFSYQLSPTDVGVHHPVLCPPVVFLASPIRAQVTLLSHGRPSHVFNDSLAIGPPRNYLRRLHTLLI